MKQQVLGLGFLALIGAALAAGCASKAADSSACDVSKCAAGNQCLSDGKVTKCRLPCPLKDDGTGGQQICPANYHCADGATPFCAADAISYTPSPKGHWGTRCNATGGIDKNPACDTDQSFWCYGTSPTDGAAFCTQFQCNSDAECRGGWFCATVNLTPDVNTTDHNVGQIQKVCMPRTYCSPCAADVDCPFDNGTRQRCVNDTAGGKYCAAECTTDTNCNQEAQCLAHDEAGGAQVCSPRAGVCVGDGGLCSPCRSDGDCKKDGVQGACTGSPYSTEHSCVVPSGKECKLDATRHLIAECPASEIAGGKVSCSLPDEWPAFPASYCYGTVTFGSGQEEINIPGCYTPKR